MNGLLSDKMNEFIEYKIHHLKWYSRNNHWAKDISNKRTKMIHEPVNKEIGLNVIRNEFRISKCLYDVKEKKRIERTPIDFKNILDDKWRNWDRNIFFEKKLSTKTPTPSLSKTCEQLFLGKIFAHRIQDLQWVHSVLWRKISFFLFPHTR